MKRPDFQLEIELDDASDRSHIRNALRENQFHHSRTDLSWSFEVSRNLGCIAVSISATLFGAALDYRSDLGDALAQVTSVCQLVVAMPGDVGPVVELALNPPPPLTIIIWLTSIAPTAGNPQLFQSDSRVFRFTHRAHLSVKMNSSILVLITSNEIGFTK